MIEELVHLMIHEDRMVMVTFSIDLVHQYWSILFEVQQVLDQQNLR